MKTVLAVVLVIAVMLAASITVLLLLLPGGSKSITPSGCAADAACHIVWGCCGAPSRCEAIPQDVQEPCEEGVACYPASLEIQRVWETTYCECSGGSCVIKNDIEKACDRICADYEADGCVASEEDWDFHCAEYSCSCFE